MMLKVTHLIWEQKTVGHELVVDWEESLEPAYDDTEDIFLGEMVHERIPIEDAFSHFNYVKIMIPQRHTVPE